jgi:phage tail-like protein
MSEKSHQGHHANYNYVITVTGLSDDGRVMCGAFSEVSGLENEVSQVEHRSGSNDITVQKVSGLEKFNSITLKRGVTADLALWNWIQKAMSGQVERVNCIIVLLDERRKEVMRWKLTRAWPSKWTGPGLNAVSNEVVIETLEICHEGVEINRQD